jgi:glycerol kinase
MKADLSADEATPTL